MMTKKKNEHWCISKEWLGNASVSNNPKFLMAYHNSTLFLNHILCLTQLCLYNWWWGSTLFNDWDWQTDSHYLHPQVTHLNIGFHKRHVKEKNMFNAILVLRLLPAHDTNHFLNSFVNVSHLEKPKFQGSSLKKVQFHHGTGGKGAGNIWWAVVMTTRV